MCGITGWVDFQRDLTRQEKTAERMVATMACRGPDAAGLWLRPRVALGHRRLAVIDLPGGQQPMSSPETTSDGDPLAVLSYSGEVYNFAELRDELAAHGHRFRTRSDTEVVLRAYLQWGHGFVERLNGMFAFAIWDNRAQELLLVRDRLGVKPLFYYPTPDGVLFGSEPKAILANPLSSAEITVDGLRDAISFLRVPGQTPLRGMHEVKPGHLVRVRGNGLAEQRYWSLTGNPHTDDLRTTISTVRELLDDIMSRQMISDVPLCTLLSGGLDSSVITALAQRTANARGEGKVRAFSVDFVGYTSNFEPEPLREAPDSPYAAELAAHAGTDHTTILLNNADLVDPAVREEVLRAWDLPYGLGDHDPSLYLLFKAIREHSTVALSGESADEVFGGYLWSHLPRAVEADTFSWHALASESPASLSTRFFRPDLVKELSLPEYVADQYQTALAEVPHPPDQSEFERRMRNNNYLNITRWMPQLLDRKDRMSMANGLEVRVPFCDHRLVEYVYGTPWAMKTFDGREKSLLRAAATDLLPESILQRRKAPYPSTQDTAYDEAINQELGKIVANPDSPALPLLDVEACRAQANQPVTQPCSMFERILLAETPIRLNNWLGAYGVSYEQLK
ncbi:asparagine synthase (glutamine-hydrolyzing) [Amycolatopsis sp. VS8301801F10]|uniref:asparagine synthase (glutamine-hydrolyzing) n=1 Tax=unclassified Amycolatopsis TaxID=2618356 RepID=UPI0038FCD5A7